MIAGATYIAAILVVCFGSFIPSTLAAQEIGKSSQCNGVWYPLMLDFNRDQFGKPFAAGDTPGNLPEGIRLKGYRRGVQSSLGGGRRPNDLVIFNTNSPTGADGFWLRRRTVGKVVVVNANGQNKTEPDDYNGGGVMIFNFPRGPVQLDSISFLHLGRRKRGEVQVFGRRAVQGSFTNRLEADSVRWRRYFNNLRNLEDVDKWFHNNPSERIDRLRINLYHGAAVASLNLTVCGKGMYGAVNTAFILLQFF